MMGIYQIYNKQTNQRYVGCSTNIWKRIRSHFYYLEKRIHHNYLLQDAYDKYGDTAFEVSVLEVLEDESFLFSIEQKYLNELNIKEDYNLYNSDIKNNESKIYEFVDYINTNWLLQSNSDNESTHYIYRTKDKNNIVKMAIRCKILLLYPSEYTYLKVIAYMKKELGYDIEDRRNRFEMADCQKSAQRYKIILSCNNFPIDKTQ